LCARWGDEVIVAFMCSVLKFISKKSNKKQDETRVTSVAGVVEFTDTSVQLFPIRTGRVGYMHSL